MCAYTSESKPIRSASLVSTARSEVDNTCASPGRMLTSSPEYMPLVHHNSKFEEGYTDFCWSFQCPTSGMTIEPAASLHGYCQRERYSGVPQSSTSYPSQSGGQSTSTGRMLMPESWQLEVLNFQTDECPFLPGSSRILEEGNWEPRQFCTEYESEGYAIESSNKPHATFSTAIGFKAHKGFTPK